MTFGNLNAALKGRSSTVVFLVQAQFCIWREVERAALSKRGETLMQRIDLQELPERNLVWVRL